MIEEMCTIWLFIECQFVRQFETYRYSLLRNYIYESKVLLNCETNIIRKGTINLGECC